MKARVLACAAALGLLLALPACSSVSPSLIAADAVASGFWSAAGRAQQDTAVRDAAERIEAGIISQPRQRQAPPRTEREAIERLRARRQELLRRIQ